MKPSLLILLLVFSLFASGQTKWPHGKIVASTDGHYLQYSDGAPFFWLGDTACMELDRARLSIESNPGPMFEDWIWILDNEKNDYPVHGSH